MRRTTRSIADAVAIGIAIVVALVLRIAGPFTHVFRADGVRFPETDPWLHVRLIEHLVRNFPHRLPFDPYLVFPTGELVPLAPLFDYLVATVAWATGLGHPSTHHVEIVAAFAPAVIGALTIVPVYFLAHRLFGRLSAAIAAAILAIMPGPLLQRTLLGDTDHHALEALLAATTILLFVRALTSSRTRDGLKAVPDERPRGTDAVVAGCALGLYLLAWTGGSLLVAVITAWALLQIVVDHPSGRPIDDLTRLVLTAFSVALIVVFIPPDPFYRRETHVAALLLGIACVATLWTVSRILNRLRARPELRRGAPSFALPAALVVAAGIAFLAFRAIAPVVTKHVLEDLGRFGKHDASLTIGEIRPLLTATGVFSLVPPWLQYRTTWFLGLAGLAALIWRAVRRHDRADTLVAVWSVAMLAITLGQQRFGYYLALCLAVLTGWVCGGIWRLAQMASSDDGERAGPLSGVVAAFIIAGLAFVPLITPARLTASVNSGPSDAWIESLRWLRANTPEPLGRAGAFDAMYLRPPNDGPYLFPPSAYGVMAWWDYGYWILHIGHRIPTANPTQTGAVNAATFLTATTADAAAKALDRAGGRYVIVDAELLPRMPPGSRQVIGTFAAMTAWAGVETATYYDIYYSTSGGGLQPVVLYYPDYFRSTVARLYLFDGAAAPADGLVVVSYTDAAGQDGRPFKLIHELRQFDATQTAAADAYAAAQSGFRRRIVSLDPTRSCVALPVLAGLRLAYASSGVAAETHRAAVKIFTRAPPPT